jgi:P-type Cu+ transporter
MAESARVEGAADAGALIAAIRQAGYEARPGGAGGQSLSDRREEEAASLKRDLSVAAVLTAPVFVLEMSGHLVPAFHHWLFALIGQGTR